MVYQFTKDLETGNAAIDSEHRQLIQAINDLLSACSSGKGRGELEKTTHFLSEYTAKHFSHEETLQKQSRYPDYINHRKYHENFKKVVKDLCGRLEKEGPTIALVGQVNTAIGGWLVNHIKHEDTKLAAHLKAQ